MKSGKRETNERKELPWGHWSEEKLQYFGVLEADAIKQTEMKEK